MDPWLHPMLLTFQSLNWLSWSSSRAGGDRRPVITGHFNKCRSPSDTAKAWSPLTHPLWWTLLSHHQSLHLGFLAAQICPPCSGAASMPTLLQARSPTVFQGAFGMPSTTGDSALLGLGCGGGVKKLQVPKSNFLKTLISITERKNLETLSGNLQE